MNVVIHSHTLDAIGLPSSDEHHEFPTKSQVGLHQMRTKKQSDSNETPSMGRLTENHSRLSEKCVQKLPFVTISVQLSAKKVKQTPIPHLLDMIVQRGKSEDGSDLPKV
ncbi:hypothetical protein T265_10791 [Opisthorchis viverrini]|uniref:Uncharacterized protein n=1 Tax=Opisthorchis viverrini TaxID=6198 RepID=A0A074Z1A2_OPIVI|nr:hypothetical protein T265_10791 [Opisthorchis viverrini]KER20738.1 hypothetical protein T265_10791 [Opisthorchis viverrini]